MTDPDTIESSNAKTMKKVDRFRKSGRRKSIKELKAAPPYCGFLEAAVLRDVRFSMFLCNNDDGIALRWLWHGAYEPMTMGLWSLLARRSKTILDVGAHSGAYSLAAAVANPKASVTSLEPYGLNFARLLINLRANGLSSDGAWPVAVSDRVGTVSFSVTGDSWYLSSGGSVGTRERGIVQTVPSVTLDHLRAESRRPFDLIKIDVEGHEPAVFRGAGSVLADDAPDMFVECAKGDDFREEEALLAGHGYRFFLIDDEFLTVEPVERLARVEVAGGVDKQRLNRLVTKRSVEEVEALGRAVRDAVPQGGGG